MMRLYDYFRSSASYRVRIALAYKQLDVELQEVHLVNQGGQQHHLDYTAINPQALVPTLVVDDLNINQSLAIIDYLEQIQPTPSLYPEDAIQRMHANRLALTIACDIHPLNNLRVLNYLKTQFNATQANIQDWYHHWLKLGFDTIENNLNQVQQNPAFCIGTQVTLADICLIPQVYNAKRFEFCLDDYPRVTAIYHACMTMPCFEKTKP